MFPYLLTPLPCIPSGIPDLPLPAWGKRQLGGGGKGGMREGPSVGFFTCLEETDRNESSRKKLPAALLLRAQLSGASLPSHHAILPPSSLLLQAGAPVREHGWAAGLERRGSNPLPAT